MSSVPKIGEKHAWSSLNQAKNDKKSTKSNDSSKGSEYKPLVFPDFPFIDTHTGIRKMKTDFKAIAESVDDGKDKKDQETERGTTQEKKGKSVWPSFSSRLKEPIKVGLSEMPMVKTQEPVNIEEISRMVITNQDFRGNYINMLTEYLEPMVQDFESMVSSIKRLEDENEDLKARVASIERQRPVAALPTTVLDHHSAELRYTSLNRRMQDKVDAIKPPSGTPKTHYPTKTAAVRSLDISEISRISKAIESCGDSKAKNIQVLSGIHYLIEGTKYAVMGSDSFAESMTAADKRDREIARLSEDMRVYTPGMFSDSLSLPKLIRRVPQPIQPVKRLKLEK